MALQLLWFGTLWWVLSGLSCNYCTMFLLRLASDMCRLFGQVRVINFRKSNYTETAKLWSRVTAFNFNSEIETNYINSFKYTWAVPTSSSGKEEVGHMFGWQNDGYLNDFKFSERITI
jgi:hypothetical protein